MIPDPAAIADLAERLKTGGWRTLFHADARDHSLWAFVSKVDGRAGGLKSIPRRGGKPTATYSFDPAQIAQAPAAALTATGFPTLTALAEHILRHDAGGAS